MIEEISLTDVQDFIVREVAQSAAFQAQCVSLLGTNMNYYRGSDLSVDAEELPYFVSYKFNFNNLEGNDPYWITQFIIGIDGQGAPVVDADGITILSATDHVETLAISALGIIKQGIMSGGIKGNCTLRVSDTNVLITEVGEADDVQAIVTIRLESYSLLN